MEELWAEVEGFPNYQISSWGRVYNQRLDRFLTPSTNRGRLRVHLYNDNGSCFAYVHILVFSHFGDYRRDVEVVHLNENLADNRVENLGHRLRDIAATPYTRRAGWGQRVRIRETGEIFRTVGDCARYIGGDFSKVYAVLRGERHHHLGFTFEWIEEV